MSRSSRANPESRRFWPFSAPPRWFRRVTWWSRERRRERTALARLAGTLDVLIVEEFDLDARQVRGAARFHWG